jgi:hypothetical protein
MDSISEGNEGFYQGRYLPEKLAERAARVTDDPMQFSLSSFRSKEALHLCKLARADLISAREIMSRDILRRAREERASQAGLTDGR